MNTLVLGEMLKSRVITQLAKRQVVKPFCNTELLLGSSATRQGDTVRVPIFPTLTAREGGVAGSAIPEATVAVTSDTMTVDQRAYDNRVVTDWEVYLNNFSLQEQIAREFALGINRVHEDHIWSQIIDNVYADTTTNRLADTTPVAETAATIYPSILQFREIFLDLWVSEEPGEVVVFIPPSVAKLIPQSAIRDATETGLKGRVAGYLGRTVDGSDIVVTPRMPKVDSDADGAANYTWIVAMKKGSVNFIDALTQMKVTEKTDGFSANFLYESIFKADVIGDPAKRMLIRKKVTNLTNTTLALGA